MESSLAVPPPLARHIRDLRHSRNLTLAELATASTISRASLSRIENGEVSPTADTLAAWAELIAAAKKGAEERKRQDSPVPRKLLEMGVRIAFQKT